jgi:hypothetical protein
VVHGKDGKTGVAVTLCGWQDATGTVERHASASAGDAELDAGRCAISPPRRSKPADERLCAHAAIAARADYEHAAIMRGDTWLRHVRAISARAVVAGLTLVWLGQVGKGPHDPQAAINRDTAKSRRRTVGSGSPRPYCAAAENDRA